MKILQINKLYYPWLGGVETHVQQLAEELVKQPNIDLKVLCCNTKLRTVKQIVNKVKVIRAASFGIFFSMPVSLKFFKLLKQEEADILHFHLPNPLAVMAYLIMRPKGKVVVTWHSDIVRQKLFLLVFAPFLHLFLQKTDTIFATSPKLVASSALLTQYQHKVKIVPLSLDLAHYQKTPEIEKRIETIKQTQPNFILFVGRLVYYKGVQVLISALKNTNMHLIMIGRGPLEEEINKQIAELGLTKQVTILPPQSFNNLLAYFYACQFFVLPSICNSEAFGIVQLEAMACGKPVVSSNLPTGVTYVNLHGVTGLTAETGNANALREALLTLNNDPVLCQTMGTTAQKRVQELFTLDKMIADVLDGYKN